MDTADTDVIQASVNLNFPDPGNTREADFPNDVGLHPEATNSSTNWDLTTKLIAQPKLLDRFQPAHFGIAGCETVGGDTGAEE